MNAIPENVLVAFRFAQGLWPNDLGAGSEATALAWSRSISGYTVDELCTAFEELSKRSPKMPPLAHVLDELREVRRKTTPEPPLLTPPAPVSAADPCKELRDRNRRELIRFHRDARGHISREKLAEIEAEVTAVGPYEQRAIAYIAANPNADWGRVCRELVESLGRKFTSPVSREVRE